MTVDQEPCEHEGLLDWLVDRGGLRAVAAEACENAGIEGREERVAYCLTVLARKADPARRQPDGTVKRTYCLDPCAECFPGRLAWWADQVARNLRDWGSVYEAIHDEADVYEIHTLRSMIHARHGDDVIDTLADGLAAVLANGPRLGEMSVDLAREFEPPPAEYAFQTPLSQWVRTAVKRKRPRDTDPLDERAERREQREVSDDLEEAERVADLVERAFVASLANLAEMRGLLAEEIGRAGAFERGLARQAPASREAADALVRVRADLVYRIDALTREKQALRPMLAYVVLAMRSSPNLQRVTVLSLRAERLERAVIDSMSATMHAIIEDELQPTPALVRMTTKATAERAIAKTRVKALQELQDAPERRAMMLAPVVRMLHELPSAVADVAAIATVLETKAGIVATNRNAAVNELTAVNAWFARVFRRYAIGRR
jgi:hypothetical protein